MFSRAKSQDSKLDPFSASYLRVRHATRVTGQALKRRVDRTLTWESLEFVVLVPVVTIQCEFTEGTQKAAAGATREARPETRKKSKARIN
jgi:hypothetical protein